MLKPWRVITNIEPHFKVMLSRWNTLRSLFMHSSFKAMFLTMLYKKANFTSQNILAAGFFAFTKAKSKVYSNVIVGIALITNVRTKAVLNFKNISELGFEADLFKKLKMRLMSAFKIGFSGTYQRKRNKKINNIVEVGFISSRYKKGGLRFDNGIFKNQTILSLKNTEIKALKSKTIRWIKKIYIMFPQFKIGLFVNLLKKTIISFYSKIEIGFSAQLLNKIEIILTSKFAFTFKALLKYKGNASLRSGIKEGLFAFNRKKGELHFGDRRFVNPMILLLKPVDVRIIKSKNILWFKEANAVMPQFQIEFETYIKKKSEINHTVGYLKTLNVRNIKQKTIGIIKTQY